MDFWACMDLQVALAVTYTPTAHRATIKRTVAIATVAVTHPMIFQIAFLYSADVTFTRFRTIECNCLQNGIAPFRVVVNFQMNHDSMTDACNIGFILFECFYQCIRICDRNLCVPHIALDDDKSLIEPSCTGLEILLNCGK